MGPFALQRWSLLQHRPLHLPLNSPTTLLCRGLPRARSQGVWGVTHPPFLYKDRAGVCDTVWAFSQADSGLFRAPALHVSVSFGICPAQIPKRGASGQTRSRAARCGNRVHGAHLETFHVVIIWRVVHRVCFVARGLGIGPTLPGQNEPF